MSENVENAILEILEMLDFINAHGGFTEYNDYSELHDAVSLIPCNDWISVEDALPHAEYGEGISVLTIDTIGLQRVAEWNGGNWCWPSGEVIATCGKFPITHWMPLPKPPEVKE